jgi:hypothetical protein
LSEMFAIFFNILKLSKDSKYVIKILFGLSVRELYWFKVKILMNLQVKIILLNLIGQRVIIGG